MRTKKIINCFWKNKLLFEKIPFKLSQIERNYLQKCLKENGAISTKLFPDFEGVKKNIVFSEDYNILRDWHIAYQEADFHQTWTTDSGLNKDQIDQLDEGEFFAFQ